MYIYKFSGYTEIEFYIFISIIFVGYPFVVIFYLNKPIFGNISLYIEIKRRSFITFLLIVFIFLSMFLFIYIAYLHFRFWPFIVFGAILYAFFLFFVGFSLVWRQFAGWRSDRILFLERTRRFNPNRSAIAQAFLSFKTGNGRERYARWIESEAHAPEDLDALYDLVSNPWPDGHRPNIDNDAGSTLLAKLDERWLKLDV